MKEYEHKVNVKLGNYSLDSSCFNDMKGVRKYIDNYTTENINENLFGTINYLDVQFIITDSEGGINVFE